MVTGEWIVENVEVRDLRVKSESAGTALYQGPAPLAKIAVLLFLFLNCAYLATSTGRARSMDEIDPVLQSESLLLRHTTAIPQAVGSAVWFGKLDREGRPRSAWPAGHAMLVLPWSALGHFALAKAMPARMTDLGVSAAICWSNATFAALCVTALFLLFARSGARPRDAAMCSLVAALATPLFVYSGWLFSEPVSAALFAIAALLLFAEDAPGSAWRISAGALALAISMHVRPANTATVAVFLVASLVHDHVEGNSSYRNSAILAAVIALSGALYLLRNYELFGSPFDFGVPKIAENGKDLDSWRNPFWRGVAGFLFSPGKSIFVFSPPVILGILGVPRFWRRNRALCVLAVLAPTVALAMYSFRTQWEGSYCYGPRYLLPAMTLLLLPIAALVQESPRWFRPVFWVTAVAGATVQVLGLSANIMEDMVRNHYYVGNWDYRMSYSPIAGQLRLIWKYLHEGPAQLGLGWDRWFLFLRDGGASAWLVYGVEAAFAAGVLAFGWMLWQSLSEWERAGGASHNGAGGSHTRPT